MNRWNICQMVDAQILGFLTFERLKKYEPFEVVERLERYVNNDNGVIRLKARIYEAYFKDEFLLPCQRFFKGAGMLLTARPRDDVKLGHLLLFDLGKGFFAVLSPFVLPDKEELEEE
jgi:hypothetical protein